MLIIPPSRLFLIKKCINNIHQRRHFVQRNLLTLKERAGFIQDIFPSTSEYVYLILVEMIIIAQRTFIFNFLSYLAMKYQSSSVNLHKQFMPVLIQLQVVFMSEIC